MLRVVESVRRGEKKTLLGIAATLALIYYAISYHRSRIRELTFPNQKSNLHCCSCWGAFSLFFFLSTAVDPMVGKEKWALGVFRHTSLVCGCS